MDASTNFYEMSTSRRSSGMDDHLLEGTNQEANFSSSNDNAGNHHEAASTQDHNTTAGSETMHLSDDSTFFDNPESTNNMENIVHRVSDVSSKGRHPVDSSHENGTPETGPEDKTTLQDDTTRATRNTTSPFLDSDSSQTFGGREKTHNKTSNDGDQITKTKGSNNNNNNNNNINNKAEESTDPGDKEPGEASEFDVIARDTAMTLDKNLDSARAWTKKLLREITMYVKTLEMVQGEYARVQDLEHKESARLDQVEPDVQGATSTLLGSQYLGDESQTRLGSSSYGHGRQTGSGSKRKISHP